MASPSTAPTLLEFHVLLALADGASHGYAIGREVELRSEGRLRPGTGSLYQALRRLDADGLIESTAAPASETDARRQYFRLTREGRRVARDEARRLEGLVRLARSKAMLPAEERR